MRLGGGTFSDEEVWMLRKLPAVANVTRSRITYADTFKQACTMRYLAGESPTKIFREAGLSPSIIGYKRIERSVARWKAKALQSMQDTPSAEMMNHDVVTRLADRYGETGVAKGKSDDAVAFVPPIDGNDREAFAGESDDGTGGTSHGFDDARVWECAVPEAACGESASDDGNASSHFAAALADIIIAQQARRISELERANKLLLSRLNA